MKIVFIITIVVFSGWPWMVLQVGSTPLSECRPRACPTQARQEAAKAGGGKDLRPSRRTASIQHSHTRSRTHARAVALVAEAAAGAARKNLKKSNLSQKRRKNELQEVHHVSWTGQGDGVHPLLLVIRAQVPAIYHLVAAYELEHQPERSACLTSSSAKVSERANERTPWRSSSCTFGLALMHAISSMAARVELELGDYAVDTAGETCREPDSASGGEEGKARALGAQARLSQLLR